MKEGPQNASLMRVRSGTELFQGNLAQVTKDQRTVVVTDVSTYVLLA